MKSSKQPRRRKIKDNGDDDGDDDGEMGRAG